MIYAVRVLVLWALVLLSGARAGYLHAPLPPPVVSYGYHTAVVTKPLVVHPPLHPPLVHPPLLHPPLVHPPLLHPPLVHPPLVHPPLVLPPPVYVKPIATSYQSFHKVDRPVYPLVVKALPLPLTYGHHYPHYPHYLH
ncbi:hypothetical protein ONE63_006282 [Megalurothrips usitatus]|uniref:Uncharacterized protein n=1 Tax=Megalurothrips usitatus TaxID=439358 RepID=A0AAV7Y0B1_9NEOP|nr:hypothetical protein ONE63_006282 [Megalurothrips usitatus]